MNSFEFDATPEEILRGREDKALREAQKPEHAEIDERRNYLQGDGEQRRDEVCIGRVNKLIPEVLTRLKEHEYPEGELAYVPGKDGIFSKRAIWFIGSTKLGAFLKNSEVGRGSWAEPDDVPTSTCFYTIHALSLGSDGSIYHRLEKPNKKHARSAYRRIPVETIESIDTWCDRQADDLFGRTGLIRLLLGRGNVLDSEFDLNPQDESFCLDRKNIISILERDLMKMRMKYARPLPVQDRTVFSERTRRLSRKEEG